MGYQAFDFKGQKVPFQMSKKKGEKKTGGGGKKAEGTGSESGTVVYCIMIVKRVGEHQIDIGGKKETVKTSLGEYEVRVPCPGGAGGAQIQ